MACIKSVRSKLASAQMTEEASLLASMLTHVPQAKHTSLGSMCVGHPGQRASLDHDAVMLTSKDVRERPHKARSHKG